MRGHASMASKLLVMVALAIATLDTGRMPERNPSRSSSFEWTADVLQRLRVLEQHAAEAARESVRSADVPSFRGWSAPLPPAAGSGSVR